jgi:prefoldin subunit 5
MRNTQKKIHDLAHESMLLEQQISELTHFKENAISFKSFEALISSVSLNQSITFTLPIEFLKLDKLDSIIKERQARLDEIDAIMQKVEAVFEAEIEMGVEVSG